MRRLLLLVCLLALCLAEPGCKKDEPQGPTTHPPPVQRLKKPAGVK
jgi:hypothetical protein